MGHPYEQPAHRGLPRGGHRCLGARRAPARDRLAAPAVLVGLVALAACDRAPSAGASGITAYDSAAVRVVVNHAPVVANEDAWRLDPEPVLRIGGIGAEGPAAVFGVTGVQRLSDGRIVVADGSRELRVFDAEGRLVESYGGAGEGPGEFLHISALRRLHGDSLLIVDVRTGRVTVLAPDGSVGRVSSLPTELPGALHGTAVASDGGIIMVRGRGFGIDAADGVHRVTYTLYRVSPEGTTIDSLGSWPGPEMFVRTSGRSVAVTQTLLSGRTYLAVGDSALFVGTSDRHQVERLSFDGRLRGLIEWAAPRAVVDADLLAAVVEERLARLDDENHRRRTRRAFDEMPTPDSVPAFRGMLVDDTGHLWVRRYPLPGDTAAVYDVFDPSGRWQSVVHLPPDLVPMQIDEDFVLGVQRDELDVESVVMMRLRRGARRQPSPGEASRTHGSETETNGATIAFRSVSHS